MKRFFGTAGMMILGLAILLGYRLSKIPWEPAAPFDIIGFLWLIQNFPKLIGWVAAWSLGVLSVLCFWKALTLPTVRMDLHSEQRRLISHLLVDPVGGGRAAGGVMSEPSEEAQP